MTIDPWTKPLSQETIDKKKKMLVEEFEVKLEDTTCFNCKAQKENRCVCQWDPYNTNGDCLLSK
jgi:hypothetical protein